ncbi:MAG: hypothetical protein WC510_02215 [Candidatus Omnitrophota bacterium]
MNNPKTKSIRDIEQKMQGLDESSLRYRILENTKSFKTSWIALGQALYSVWKDKIYRQWGYQAFDAYTSREIGIKKHTAMKLLRSYYFLEKEEPGYLRPDYIESAPASSVPGYDSIDVLRLVKNKKVLDEGDYARFKKEIFENGKDASGVRKDLVALIREREEVDPGEAAQKRREAILRRFLSTLKSLKKEIEIARLLPVSIINEAEELIERLESEIG